MLNKEFITETITGHRDVLRHHTISEAEVIPELPPRQLCTRKVMRYIAKPHPINPLPMEAAPLLASRQLLLSIQIRHLQVLPLFPCTCASPAYTIPMAYVV